MLKALFIIVLFVFSMVCPSYGNDYSEYNIGDKISLYMQNDKNNYYVFANTTSCFTCLMSLSAIHDMLSDTIDVNFILFLSGANKEYVTNIVKQNNWDFLVVEDPLGVYRSFYFVNQLPVFIASTPDGQVLSIGKSGSEDDDIPKLISLYTHQKNKSVKITSKDLVMTNNFIVTENNLEVLCSKDCTINYSQLSGKYLITNRAFKNILLVDSNGVVEKKYNYTKFQGIQSLAFYNPCWIIEDSLLLCTYMNFKSETWMYTLNILDGNITNHHIHNDLDNYFIGYNTSYNPKSLEIITNYIPKSNTLMTDTNVTLERVKLNGTFIDSFGRQDSQYQKYKCTNFSYSVSNCDSDGYIYEGQGISNEIDVYDPNASLVKTIKCNFDEYWRSYNKDINERSSYNEFVEINKQVSFVDNIIINHEMLGIVYRNYSNDSKMNWIVHFISKNGEKLRSDIILPDNMEPFFCTTKMIGASKSIDNNLYIYWFNIQEKE